MGFDAIRVPTVSTAEQARQIVRFAKFAPEGDRGACPFVRANDFGGRDQTAYYENANKQLVIAANIEGEEGVKHMEEINRHPGHRHCECGPGGSLCGLRLCPGQTRHPLVEQAVRRVSELCLQYGKCSGTYIEKPEDAAKYKDCPGITHFLTVTPESVLIRGYRQLYSAVRENM